MLEIKGLCSGYQNLQILWDVDLAVQEGEWVALIGSAGAGKTTFMSTLTGLIPPFSGAVRFLGEDITNLEPHERVRRGIALAPEGRRLFTGMTVFENLKMGAFLIREKSAISGQLERIYDLLPILKERRGQVVGTLSGGEQQMCAIGRALMSQPRLLLIDELSLGLAPVVVDALLEALVIIKKEGTTLLVIEQDVQTALDYADRGYVLREGRIVTSGPAGELLANENLQKEYLGV